MKFHEEQRRLVTILTDRHCVIRYSKHATVEMANDAITHADVLKVLRTGQVTWFEIKKDEIIHVEGADIDGRRIRLVVGLRDQAITLQIITVMALTNSI
ncbi:MAG: DUF4258 domain-containing protein [Reyranella sp.]|uniref:DUF4258 domain-containing protein n=1 Tax=Reyranella sp. TaxID=1929291 RepID=UPI0011FF2CD6|nr:DUF4258 domain-containing protein [Reyranella sp.]TAJ96985.1 MAG: DUF4258 domain-containing protein [Reyranella sp.]TBR28379.1 MAG: DUF4258 domain-containing protein [Reyranella sp.]